MLTLVIAAICDRLKNVLISITPDFSLDDGFGEVGTVSQCSYSSGTQPAVRLHNCSRTMYGRYIKLTAVESNNFINIHEMEIMV